MNDDLLVVVFLRGGMDGLNLVGPSADPIYQNERRQDTRVERDGDHPGLVLPNTFADSDFRFHFKAQPLKNLYDAKQLAIVHACGLTNGTRSHFEAQDYMELGTEGAKNLSTGWLARHASLRQVQGFVPVVAANNNMPLSLLGCADAVAAPNARKLTLQGNDKFKAARDALLKAAYHGSGDVENNGARILEVLDIFATRLPKDKQGKLQDYTPAADAHYPADGYANELSNGLKSLAQVMKMDVGLRVATIDYGGWDTHVGQGGRFTNQVDGLARSLEAFWIDMKKYHDRLTVVAMSEFGRRLKSNDSGGTDHGHGNCMLVLGGKINGGNIYGKWPGLANEQLDNQVDLAVTTDYRNVLAEITGTQKPGTLFPGFTGYKPLGLVRA